QMALSGRSLTDAAHSAGFSDSAHFARLHRDTFGVTPSYTFRKLARVGKLARSGPSDECGPSRVSPEARSIAIYPDADASVVRSSQARSRNVSRPSATDSICSP